MTHPSNREGFKDGFGGLRAVLILFGELGRLGRWAQPRWARAHASDAQREAVADGATRLSDPHDVAGALSCAGYRRSPAVAFSARLTHLLQARCPGLAEHLDFAAHEEPSPIRGSQRPAPGTRPLCGCPLELDVVRRCPAGWGSGGPCYSQSSLGDSHRPFL